MEYLNAKGILLKFFYENMYSSDMELFNTKVTPFLNDSDRMRYFIERFNTFIFGLPHDTSEHNETYKNEVDQNTIDSVLMTIEIIKEYLWL